MIADIKYIYNDMGEVEAAIVPIQTWRAMEQKIETKPTPFHASKFRGIFSHLNIDVEQEIKKVRDEWKRNF